MACKRCGKDLRSEICDDEGQIVRDHVCMAWWGGFQNMERKVNRNVFKDYKKHSAPDGVWANPGSFVHAFRAARDHIEPKRPKFEWKTDSRTGAERASLKVEGFHVVVELVMDPHGNWALDGLGKFTDKYEPGAIYRKEGLREGRDKEYRYFVPEVSYAEHYKGLREMGYSKFQADFLAREYNHRDYKQALRINAGEIGEWDILCSIYKKGVKLAGGQLGVGVIDSFNSEKSYVEDLAWDCIGNTLYEAKKKLAELRSDDEEESSEEN